MNKHWTEIDIYSEIEELAAQKDVELDEEVGTNPLLMKLGGMELVLLETLGYTVDLKTGQALTRSID